MIKSMTAFARAEVKEGDLNVVIEIRTYNNRYLDFSIRLPHGYSAIEDKMKGEIKKTVSRGRVDVKTYIKSEAEDSKVIEVKASRALALKDTLSTLKKEYDIKPKISMESLFGQTGVLESVTKDKDIDKEWPIVSKCLAKALVDLDGMRLVEGEFIQKDFVKRLTYIEDSVAKIEGEMDGILDVYQEKLKDRIEKLTKGEVELDPARIAQEAAILADKSDVSEEVTRSDSHIKQFREIMEKNEPSGQKLNFLLQEFNREFNTMGSKIGNASISHIVVDLKSELEKLREQVQNIE
ncbi:MAG: YicC family protein [Deltaproteobacteria bacterium]|nr:YicC family protein [Deltaproteobacteria bacterium]